MTSKGGQTVIGLVIQVVVLFVVGLILRRRLELYLFEVQELEDFGVRLPFERTKDHGPAALECLDAITSQVYFLEVIYVVHQFVSAPWCIVSEHHKK